MNLRHFHINNGMTRSVSFLVLSMWTPFQEKIGKKEVATEKQESFRYILRCVIEDPSASDAKNKANKNCEATRCLRYKNGTKMFTMEIKRNVFKWHILFHSVGTTFLRQMKMYMRKWWLNRKYKSKNFVQQLNLAL